MPFLQKKHHAAIISYIYIYMFGCHSVPILAQAFFAQPVWLSFARQVPRGPALAMAMVKLFLFWACGTADLVTDIMFLSLAVEDFFSDSLDSGTDTGRLAFDLSCIVLLVWISLWHLCKGISVCIKMGLGDLGHTADQLADDDVSTANSPFLLFVYLCKPSGLRPYSDFIETSHPWSCRMLLDLVNQDIPSLVLNIVDTWVFNNSSPINTASIISSIASIVLSWWMIRRSDVGWNSKPNMANARTADGVSAVTSVIGVAEAAIQAWQLSGGVKCAVSVCSVMPAKTSPPGLSRLVKKCLDVPEVCNGDMVILELRHSLLQPCSPWMHIKGEGLLSSIVHHPVANMFLLVPRASCKRYTIQIYTKTTMFVDDFHGYPYVEQEVMGLPQIESSLFDHALGRFLWS